MQAVSRALRYAALVWFFAAALVALFVTERWQIAALASAFVVPAVLVVVATAIDPLGPHRPSPGDEPGPVRPWPARSG